MIGPTIAILICIALLTVAGVTVVGRLWHFVLIRPPGSGKPQSIIQRVQVIPPGPRDFAAQGVRLSRLDLPFAILFLVGSLFLLATPGIRGAWFLTFALWCIGAVTRWLTPSERAVPVRCGIVLLLVAEAMLVLAIRGGGAFPQTLLYLAAALVGALLLYRANELPLPFAPQEPRPTYRRSIRPVEPKPMPHPGYAMHYDTAPSVAPRRPLAQVTPINYARRNPLRVREDEGAVVSPPYYANVQ